MDRISFLFEEIRKMCNYLVKYDKSYFNAPASENEIDFFQKSNDLVLPDELLRIYQSANGCNILGRTATIYKLQNVGIKFKEVPEDYVVFGEIVGDGELLCFHEKTGEIATFYNNKIFKYSVAGFLEYCIDQCKDGFFMAKPELSYYSLLDSDILNDIMKIYDLKSVMIRDLAETFVQADNENREKFMHDLPIVIRAAVFSFLDPSICNEFVDTLKNKDNINGENFIRGMKRRSVDNFFNRKRKALDDGGTEYNWNFPQMRELYNFDSNGMSYLNAGVVNSYSTKGEIISEILLTRSGGKVSYNKKVNVEYKHNIYKENKYLGNVNNVKLKGV